MRTFLYLLISVFLSSCCLFTSRDCGCDPPSAYTIQQAIEWVPANSAEISFSSSDSIPQTKALISTHSLGSQCVGGDECCTNFQVNSNQLDLKPNEILIRCSSLKEKVGFITTNISTKKEVLITELQVNTDDFSNEGYFEISLSDTIVAGLKTQRIKFKKLNSAAYEVPFQELTFLKGYGVIHYIDNQRIGWTRQ